MLKGFHHRGISRPLTARVRTNPYTIWWDLSAQNPEMRVKNRLLDCPSEPPVRIELTTSFYLYGALPLSSGGIKFAGYDFQRKYYVHAAWLLVQFVRLQVGYYLRNLLTRFTTFVHIARSRPWRERVVEVVVFRDGDWLSNWCVLHLFCCSCLSLRKPLISTM